MSLSHPLARFAAYKVGLPTMIGLASVGAGVASAYVLHDAHVQCVSAQRSWDNRRDAWIALTAPVSYPDASDGLLDAEKVTNAYRLEQRRKLLDGLGRRPSC